MNSKFAATTWNTRTEKLLFHLRLIMTLITYKLFSTTCRHYYRIVRGTVGRVLVVRHYSGRKGLWMKQSVCLCECTLLLLSSFLQRWKKWCVRCFFFQATCECLFSQFFRNKEKEDEVLDQVHRKIVVQWYIIILYCFVLFVFTMSHWPDYLIARICPQRGDRSRWRRTQLLLMLLCLFLLLFLPVTDMIWTIHENRSTRMLNNWIHSGYLLVEAVVSGIQTRSDRNKEQKKEKDTWLTGAYLLHY